MYSKLHVFGDAEEISSANQYDLLFISLDWSRPKDLRTPLSTASIEAYFSENQAGNVNAEFKSFNLNSPDFDVRDVRQSIKERRPNFFALGAYIWNEQYVPDVVRWTKEHYPDTIIILGGAPSHLWESSLGDRISWRRLLHQGRGRGSFY